MSSISYLDWHLPLTTGCTKCSPACNACHAAKNAATRLCHHPFYEGLAVKTATGYDWTGEVRYHPEVLDGLTDRQKPRAIGIAFTGDLLHDALADTDIIARLRWTAQECPQHQFIFTTKRPQNLGRLGVDLPANLWVGVSVWDQASLKTACYHLSHVDTDSTWLSLEPLLEPVSIVGLERVRGIVVGCESGRTPRPMQMDWVRSLRDEIIVCGMTTFYFKQAIIDSKLVHEPELDGRQWLDLPWRNAA